MPTVRRKKSVPLDVLPPAGLSAQELRERRVKEWSEKELQEHVISLARSLGWLVYHTYDSRRSSPGYPDLHMVHPTAGRSMFRELKTEKGRASPDQRMWLETLRQARCDAGIWRPRDVVDGAVLQQLQPTKKEGM